MATTVLGQITKVRRRRQKIAAVDATAAAARSCRPTLATRTELEAIMRRVATIKPGPPPRLTLRRRTAAAAFQAGARASSPPEPTEAFLGRSVPTGRSPPGPTIPVPVEKAVTGSIGRPVTASALVTIQSVAEAQPP